MRHCVKSVQIWRFGVNTRKYGPEKTLYLDIFHAVPKIKKTCSANAWLTDPRFSSWVSKSTDFTKANWKLFKKDFSLPNMGINALVSHANGSNHLKMLNIKRKYKTFLVKPQHKKYLKVKLKSTLLLNLLNLAIQPQVPPDQLLVPPCQLQIRTNLPKNLRLNHF